MTRTLAPVRRIAALSVVITLFAAPLASAQAPEAAPAVASPANTTLLSPAAFARLVQPPVEVAPIPVVADAPRLSLLLQSTASLAREAKAVPTKAPRQQSWVSRHKVALIVFSAIVVGLAVTLTVTVPT